MRLLAFTLLLLFTFLQLPSLALASDDDDGPDSYDLLGYFPTKETHSRVKPFQLRLSYINGAASYASNSTNTISTVNVNFPDEVNTGIRIELDRWFPVGTANRRNIGFLADYQKISVSSFTTISGPAVEYTNASLLLGWRFLGFGHAQPWTPEMSLVTGVAMEAFPTMRVAVTDTKHFTLETPSAIGPRIGLRARTPLVPGLQMFSLEAAGFVTFPYHTIGTISGSVDSSKAKSYAFTALVDFQLFNRFILGGGMYYGSFDLDYTPEGVTIPSHITFSTQSWLASLRITF